MRIIVILRRVLDPSGIVVHRGLGRIFVNQEKYIIQPADHCALEVALRIKDLAEDTEVVVVSGQPEPDDDTLRRGLAMGADRAIYLEAGELLEASSGEQVANFPYDATMAQALAAVVERLDDVDLVLGGVTTLDTGQGQLGLRLAEALGWPQMAKAWSVAGEQVGEPPNGSVRAVVQRGSDYVTVETDLPAVVTMAPGALKPRYPDGVRLINTYREEAGMAEALDSWDVNELMGAEALAPLLEKRGQDFPPERERGERVSGSPEEMAQVVAEALQQRVSG